MQLYNCIVFISSFFTSTVTEFNFLFVHYEFFSALSQLMDFYHNGQVGVDNMCILVQAVKRQQVELPIEGRISNALVEVGPSITLASLSEVLAFAVGSFIPMPACRVFSMFAGQDSYL